MERCPKCGGELDTYGVRLEEGLYVLEYCKNPKCKYIKGLFAQGKIPREIKKLLFPNHYEVI